jgi:hypothetical protein
MKAGTRRALLWTVSEAHSGGRVIKAPTPPRNGSDQDGCATLWELRNDRSSRIRAELISLTDGVEVEVFRDGIFRRRWRFLTDGAARSHGARLRVRLERRGFCERRTLERPSVWPS